MTRLTAGALSLKAKADNTKYDPLEVAQALADDISRQLHICAEIHSKIFDMEEFCIILVVAGDPLIHGIRRHKYTAFPFLPKPRPQQSVFLFKKSNQSFRRLWSLPDAKVMATISEMSYVAPQWHSTKVWSDAFFRHDFHEVIRKQNGINMLTETEFLNLHREELIQAGCQEVDSSFTEPFDFTKIAIKKVVDSDVPLPEKNGLDDRGKA